MMNFVDQAKVAAEKHFFDFVSPVNANKWQSLNVTQTPKDEVLTDFQEPLDGFLRNGHTESANLKSTPINEIEYYGSDEYLSLSAKEKQNALWAEIEHTKGTSASWPNAVQLPGIFLEGMDQTFHTIGDAMDHNMFMVRMKYIHTVGAHGKVTFLPSDNNHYTGMFKGANYGIVRFSSAAQPKADGSQPLAPGMGLKFLRDGVDSSNHVAMFSVNGQPGDWNFFSNDFNNHIGPSETTATKALGVKFATETYFIQEVGLSEMAYIDEQGNKEDSNVFPFSLRYEPHSDVHTLFPKDLPGDDPMAYLGQLESIPADSNLYNVYAMNEPKELGGTETMIGTLKLDGTMTRSEWGDAIFFVRHQLMDEDLAIKDEWKKYTPQWGGSKEEGCPYLKALKEKLSNMSNLV